MAYQGVLDDIRACVELGIPGRVPVFAVSEPFDVRMSGLTHEEYTRNADTMAGCRIEAVRRFDYDWSIGWPDDYVEMETLGIKLRGGENVPLAPYEYPAASWDTLKNLRMPDFHHDGRMPAFLETLGRIKNALGDTVCLTGRVAAPFTAVALLYGVERSMSLIVEEQDLFQKTAEFLTGLMIAWGKAQIQAGADAVWLGDCVAGSGFISSGHYLEFAAEGAARVCEAIKKEGAFVFYHAGESSPGRLELMAGVRPSALSVGGKIDIRQAKETVGKRVCLLGNIRGIETLRAGTPEAVEQETARIVEEGKKGGGYIFNSEEGIPRETPEENMRAMMHTARLCGSYDRHSHITP